MCSASTRVTSTKLNSGGVGNGDDLYTDRVRILPGRVQSKSTRQLISDSANVVRHTQAVECSSSTSPRTLSASRFFLDLLFMSVRRRNAKGVSATARDTSPKTNGTTVSMDAGRQKDNGMSVLQLAPAVLDIYSVRNIPCRTCS